MYDSVPGTDQLIDYLERLVERPVGGQAHQLVLGCIFASAAIVCGIWLASHAGGGFTFTIPSRHGRGAFLDNHGIIAGSAGLALIAFGLHLHAGWFWGLRRPHAAAPEVCRITLLAIALVGLIASVVRLAMLTLR